MAKRKSPKPSIAQSPDQPIIGPVSADELIKQSAKKPFDWNEAVPALPYQWRWIKDESQLKIAVWSRQSGKSFAAALRAVIKCLEKRTQYIILSKGERQSRLFMEKVKDICQVFKECHFLPEFAELQGTAEMTMEVYFPHNHSRIIGRPANPDTARGYSGHIVLDEFAFHGDAHKIYAACFPIITRGYSIEVISTPNGTAGKFYEIAKQAGLVGLPIADGRLTIENQSTNPRSAIDNRQSTIGNSQAIWSGHRVDIYDAVAQGLPANIRLLRSGCDDEETWLQEYCCQFLSDAQNYIPVELISTCVHEEATTEWADRQIGSRQLGKAPTAHLPNSPSAELYLGVDIGRKRDLTIAWLFEKVGGVLWSRRLLTLKGVSFDEQEKAISGLIEAGSGQWADGQIGKGSTACLPTCPPARLASVRRVCIDQSGIGMMLAEHLVQKYGAVVEPVTFTASLKERLAPMVKQAFEERTVRIPDNREVRADINSVKRFVTLAGNVRFDAEHTDRGHADRFWALAMVVNAASEPTASFAEQASLAGEPVFRGFAEVVL
jgi:phage FluMu gp28-like protein